MDKLFIKGYTYGWCGQRGDYKTEEAKKSLVELKEMGTEWACISFFTWQDTFASTNIYFDYDFTVTDKDIEVAVTRAHELGMKVCLKPVVNCKDGTWRAEIGFPDLTGHKIGTHEMYWDIWFRSYGAFIKHYAELAQELGCEMFCTGCEMVTADRQKARFSKLIGEVRAIYKGLLMHNVNHGSEDNAQWLDLVDVIGVSGYYPVSKDGDYSEETMIQSWTNAKPAIKNMHDKFNKPIVFAEIGCRSEQGCSSQPWDSEIRPDVAFAETEQANFYSSVMKVFWDEPWFSGFFWWDWPAKLYDITTAKDNREFCIYGKKAEEVLKDWYTNK